MNTNQKLLRKEDNLLQTLGNQIKQTRLRRDMKSETLALNAGIGRMTLYKLEQGNAGVSIGILLKVLLVLGFEKDLVAIAKNDPLEKQQSKKGKIPNKRATRGR